MKCSKCGETLDKDSKFCTNCGNPIYSDEDNTRQLYEKQENIPPKLKSTVQKQQDSIFPEQEAFHKKTTKWKKRLGIILGSISILCLFSVIGYIAITYKDDLEQKKQNVNGYWEFHEVSENAKRTMETMAKSETKRIVNFSQTDIESIIVEGNTFERNASSAWIGAKDDLGNFKEIKNTKFQYYDTGCGVNVSADFEKKSVDFVYLFDEVTCMPVSLTIEGDYIFDDDAVLEYREKIEAHLKDSLGTVSIGMTNTIVALTKDEIDNYRSSGDVFTIVAVNAWEAVKDEAGELIEVIETEFQYEAEGYKCTVPVRFTEKDLDFVYFFDEGGKPVSLEIN